MKTTAAQPTPPAARSESTTSSASVFVSMALDMTWKLAVAVLLPIIGGVYLDKAANTNHVFLFVGLALAVLASFAVMWQAMKTANSMLVPKLSAAEKRRIQKEYEEDDKDA